jgi:glycosyltransferase involved in cell wall biosynthesis
VKTRDTTQGGTPRPELRSRSRVLVVAAACHPEVGSEPGLGWSWIREIAKCHDVVAIVGEAKGNRQAITTALERDPSLAASVRFVYIPWFHEPRTRVASLIWQYYQPWYYRKYRDWMDEAYNVALQLCDNEKIDLVHQLTMIGFREPGFPWRITKPLIWGPVGGTQNVPWACLPALGSIEGTRHLARNVINCLQVRYQQRFRRALRKASAVFAVDSSTKDALEKFHGRSSLVIAAGLCDPSHPRRRIRRRGEGALRLVFSGQHLSRKGLPFALHALALIPKSAKWTLDVLGSGPMTAKWQRLAYRLGLSRQVVFHGYVPRDTLVSVMNEADVYIFPSLLEGWPTVLGEALSLGMPVLTTDLHGMKDIVTIECGRRVTANRPSRLVAGLKAAICDLIDSPDLLTRLSEGALRRAEELSADNQMPHLMRAYRQAIDDASLGAD